jgi:hypothetical protein
MKYPYSIFAAGAVEIMIRNERVMIHAQRYILLLAMICLANPVFAGAPAPSSSISGFVYDAASGESLIGANIFLGGDGVGAVSKSNGYYIIAGLSAGRYQLICTYIGYKEFKQNITLSENQQLKTNINLEPSILTGEIIEIHADSLRTAEQLYQKSLSRLSLSPMEIRQMPAIAEADLLRSLQNLPGILPISDFSSEIYVRGGTADQNLYLMDGADVYNPEHAFGMFSTFNTDAIKHVEVSKGGFGAVYGGRMSSIIDVTNLDGNRNKMEGAAEISLLSAKTTLQLPLKKFGSLSASFRRTYFDQTVGRFIDDVPNYYFYDGHIKGFFDLGARDKLTLAMYYGKDILNYKFSAQTDEAEKMHYDWGNTTGSMRWTHIFAPGLLGNTWITASRFFSRFELTEIEETNDLTDLSAKGQFEYAVMRSLDVQFGFEYKNIDTKLLQNSPFGVIDVAMQRQHGAAYLSLSCKPSPLWQLDGGIRYNLFSSDRDFQNWEPRLSVRRRLTETMTLKAAAGRYYQYLSRIPRPFLADIWTTANSNYRESWSDHFIAGMQKEVAGNLELEIEAYYKTYRNLYTLKNHFMDLEPDGFDARGRPIYSSSKGLYNSGNGNSLGLELLLRKKYGSVTGWLAYALARTEYTIGGVNGNDPFPPRHDRTSVVNFVLNTDIKNSVREMIGRAFQHDKSSWLAGLNFIYTSGQPITLTSSTYMAYYTPYDARETYLLYPSSINGFRLPPYIRLDASLTWQRQFRSILFSSYIQIFNLGNRKNVWFISYRSRFDKDIVAQDVKEFNMLPLIPSIGVRVRF